MNNPTTKRPTKWWPKALVAPFVPLLLIVAAIALLLFVVATASLHITIWTLWCLRGRDVLFVYSDSPIWHDYIEDVLLPLLGDRAVVLNWSQRKRWRVSIARLAFHHFGGSREFNPLAVVFRPLSFSDFQVLAAVQRVQARASRTASSNGERVPRVNRSPTAGAVGLTGRCRPVPS